ncbi:PBP1A family penicillin-binding protein [Candidatus Parcubacteria bacterium]|nr:MAG: PBP1A family penicillin-binding protein [Candidatus Parcubacteria bacterium]
MGSFGGIMSRRSRRRKYQTRVVLAGVVAKYAFYGLIGFLALFFLYFVWLSRDLPTPGKLANPDIRDSTKILDKNDVVLYSIYKDYNRIYIPLKDIPKDLRDATVVSEDADFYKNQGFSWRGYIRVIKDLVVYRRLTGGSTITQQLVKNVLLSPERSITRKAKELLLAVQVDKRYSKDQILEMYLNNVPYGGTAVGVEAASNLYFGKHAKDLTLEESAFLAGLPQSPSYYSPFIGKNKSYITRSKYVLGRLEEEGYISKKQSENALKKIENFKFSERPESMKAPHFVMYVKQELIKMFGENVVENGNLTVKTTLDYEIQKKAEDTVEEEIEKLKGFNVENGSVIVMDAKTGGILAMVGSKDYFDVDNDGNFNASLGLRQPGSSLKPLMYATAIERGYTASTVIIDVETDFPTGDPEHPIYTPVNYDGKYKGPIQMRFALGNSINVPAVKMLASVGVKPVMQKAYDMGIENWKPTDENMENVGLSLVLGGREANLLQIVDAYSVFANEGVKAEPFSIVEVKDLKGKIVYKHEKKSERRVLSKETSFIISHILLDNNARQPVFGPSSWLVVPGKTVAVKTGTTDEKRDNWTVGYTPSYIVGVWVGNNDNSKMNPKIASGVTGAAPIWNKVMSFVLKGKKDEEFKKPDNVEAVEIDADYGGLPIEGHSKRTEYFVKGTEPTIASPIYKRLKVSKHQNDRIANQIEIDKGDYDWRDFIYFSEKDPVSADGINRWQEAIDAWVRENYKDDSKYFPPRDISDYKYEEKKEEPTPTPIPTPTESQSLSPTLTVTPTL